MMAEESAVRTGVAAYAEQAATADTVTLLACGFRGYAGPSARGKLCDDITKDLAGMRVNDNFARVGLGFRADLHKAEKCSPLFSNNVALRPQARHDFLGRHGRLGEKRDFAVDRR